MIQEDPGGGKLERSQEDLGKARRTQEDPGGPRKSQETQGGPGKLFKGRQGTLGALKRPQGDTRGFGGLQGHPGPFKAHSRPLGAPRGP